MTIPVYGQTQCAQRGTPVVALDISSLRSIRSNAGKPPIFTTPQKAYSPLSYSLPKRLLALTQEIPAVDTTLRNSAIASLYDIYLDLMRLARALTDIAYIRQANARPLFSAFESPILNYLLSDISGSPRAVSDILPLKRGRYTGARSLKDRLRMLKRVLLLSTTPGRNRYDVIARGGLVDQYLAEKNRRSINIDPYLLNWPSVHGTSQKTHALTAALCEIFDDIISTHGEVMPSASKKASSAARVLTQDWLSQSYANASFLSRSTLDYRHGDVLIGAAPKSLGRLLGCFYQSRNARVVRCAHGGERAFFDDYSWGLSELPFCDDYLTHGTGEAEAITQRLQEDRVLRTSSLPLKCTAIGTIRHQKIFQGTHSGPRTLRLSSLRPRVMLVTSSYLTEDAAHLPAVKPVDVQLAELHGSLLKVLHSLDCEVLFKPHPKGRIQPTDFFEGHFDELVPGHFNPILYNVDAYIFDYAGSAFFDSLASATGVILIDTGLRPFDRTTLPDLHKRCFLVPATTDETNQFQIDGQVLSQAIFKAADVDHCPETFAQKYFSPADPPR